MPYGNHALRAMAIRVAGNSEQMTRAGLRRPYMAGATRWPYARLPIMHKLLICAALAACTTVHAESKTAFSKADFDAHIAGLRAKLHAKKLGDLAIRVEEPFVVIGEADTLARSAQTVRWAADHLEADFFGKRPTKILDIYLFGDADSYEAGVKTLTGDAPTTPYGFYSSSHDGLFMNIATGGGTLVHEIVHPYVEADFPDAPPWLNEGLGSLFEQSNERDGHIIGLTNWRLAGLQKAIKRGKLQTFRPHASVDRGVLQRRLGHELRAVALSPVLPPGDGQAARVLPRLPRGPREGPERLPDARRRARQQGHGRVPEALGAVRAHATVSVAPSRPRGPCPPCRA
jgi:hypothetical protein